MMLVKHGVVKPLLSATDTVRDGYVQCLADYPTYEAAARDLLPQELGDEAPRLYFREQIAGKVSPARLRWSFVVLILHCGWTSIHFEEFVSELSCDFRLKGLDENSARLSALADLQRRLRREGKTLCCNRVKRPHVAIP